MKKFQRTLSLVLSIFMILSLFSLVFTGCDSEDDKKSDKKTESTTASSEATTETKTETTTESTSETVAESETDPTPSDGKVEYSVSISTIGGRPISSLTFYVYVEDDLVSYGTTDENGNATVKLNAGDNYTIELPKGSLEGYVVDDRYSFDGTSASIVLTSAVIADSDLTGVSYKLGDIMHDFTITTIDGTEFNLATALENKKGVLINFWYSTCSPCINEFPYLVEAYEQYKDDIEVIALNNYAPDNENAVKTFAATMGLTFPVAKDFSKLGQAFGIQYYPTSIFVDRYGTICLIEIGGLTSVKPLNAAFKYFASDNYQQQLFTSIEELTPAEKPTEEMPSSDEISAAVNANGFTATYAPETEGEDAEYSWPFLLGELDGSKCLYPSNSFHDSSFAIMHVTMNLKAGEAFAFDYFADTELSADMLYLMVDDINTYRISGTSTAWETCYPYVAVKDGEYTVSFVYLKDGDTDTETDTILLRNFRIVAASEVDKATYIPREAATDKNANGLGFNSYITPVFNENDGYYHVGSADGPILLVNLMDETQLSKTTINDLGYNGELIYDGVNLYDKIEAYANYSINGTLYGFCPVTAELREILEKVAEIVGYEQGNPDQWLQACTYYDAYGTTEQLEDPVKGVAFFAAFDTVVSTDEEIKYNTVVYDGRVIMPRGLKYKFVPTASGAYAIRSQSEYEVNGWIFDENGEMIYTYEVFERPFGGKELDTDNVNMIYYFEAGKTYYIDIAFYDIYGAGTFTFTVEFLGESYELFHLASPGYFTFVDTASGGINETIAGGIKVALGEDGYYHELLSDGTLGSIVYADFIYATGLFSHSIEDSIAMDGFNFSLNEYDLMVIAKLNELGGDKEACIEYYKNLWADEYEEWAGIYKLDEILAGKTHGDGEDLTAAITAYFDKKIAYSEECPELEGCVPVDEELARILQAFVDKYSLSGVTNSWTKLCYFYKHLGSTNG